MWWDKACIIGRVCLKREGLAFVALIASIGGAAVLTVMLAWAMVKLEGAEQWEAITNIAYGLLVIVAMVILSFGLVISKRSIEAEFWKAKFKASGGGSENDVP